jgi:hypothetical protein
MDRGSPEAVEIRNDESTRRAEGMNQWLEMGVTLGKLIGV